MDDHVERFRDACADLGVEVSVAAPAAAAEAVEAAITAPAVGIALDDYPVALAETSITVDPTGGELEAARTGVTPACLGVAASGSIVIPSTPDGSEPLSLYPKRHVAVLRAADIVPSLEKAFDALGPALADGGDAILATGPSATADMGDLVVGAHGPASVHVVVLEAES
ncbi:MAG: LUD domain-containing protein [Halobacteriaceae archaeon]